VIQTLSKQASLENYMRRIQLQPNLPAFSDHMAQLTQAVGDESTTLNLLTNIILKNVSLTAMVLRAANSFHYNPRGKPILSVSRAVTVMGWDSVRNLGVGVLLFEHFREQMEKPKELILLMLLTGNHARQVAMQAGLRGIEEAYLCGMFRNLGELIAACYLPKEYADILESANGNQRAQAEACERVLNLRFEDLGKAMAHHWNLPDTVANCMENPNLPAPMGQSDLEKLRTISSFSHALSAAVYRQDPSEGQHALQKVIGKYGATLPVKESDIPAILEAALFETEDTFRAARLPVDRAGLMSHVLAATGRERTAAQLQDGSEPAAPGPSDVLRSLIKELSVMLDAGEDFDLNAVIMMILEAIYRGAGLDRALFCLVNADRTQVQARLGVGADVEPLIEKFRFPISIRSGPIAAALLGKQDLMVDMGTSVRYSCSPFMNVVGAPCFGILPLIVDGIVAGCLYFDSDSESFTFDSQKKQALLELRRFGVTAIARKRQA
jgi:HD-like signal output (HDOD) protein